MRVTIRSFMYNWGMCKLVRAFWQLFAQWHPTPVLMPGKIPWMEEPGGLQSTGSLRVGLDWATSLSLFIFMHWRRKWQPTLVLLPGKFHGQRSLVGYSPWGHKESDTTERLHFHFLSILKWSSVSSRRSSAWFLESVTIWSGSSEHGKFPNLKVLLCYTKTMVKK